MLLVGTSSAWADYVLYYVNTNDWSGVNCYAWNNSSNKNEADWPGTAMTKTDITSGGHNVYKYESSSTINSNKCIFNNGSSQTSDLNMSKGSVYDNGTWKALNLIYEGSYGKAGTYYVAGDFNSWTVKGLAFTSFSEEKLAYYVEYDFANVTSQTTYNFKVTKGDWNGTLYDNTKIDNTRSNGTLNLEKANEENNIKFTISSPKKVTFYIDPATSKVFAESESLCTTADFSVVSLGTVAIGCTPTATIEIEGAHNPTVKWSSSNTTVATINETTGFINTIAAGETTITATTTDANGFCSGTQKTTTLTVKNPLVTISANTTTLCAGEELTLTATVTDAGTGNTYQWYKGDNSISGATSEAYTINSVSANDAATYKVEVSGGILCQAKKSAGVTVTVYALPTAPTFTTNSAQVCSGVAFNLNEKFPRNSGEAGTLTWYKASDNSQVSDPASVTITESTSYYAKATNNNCTSDKSLNCTVNVDANPTLELASTPTVCPDVEIDLDDYATYNTGTLTWYSNQERTTVITDGLVTPTERTTYYAKVINGTCNPVEKEFTINVYGIADDMPAYTSTPATSCKGTPNSDGSIALKKTIGYITYTLDGKEADSNIWTGLSVGTHKLAATINTCPSLTKEWDVEVEVEYITPAATVSITGDASFCEGGNTVLTSVVTATQGEATAYQWYNGEELIQGATASTYTANAAGNYKVVVTVLNSTCQDKFWSGEKVVTINPKPNEPVLSIPSPICAGSNFTLPEEDNNQRNITWNVHDRELTNLTAGRHNYTAKIIDVNGCESNEVTYTITVTALPEITSISQDIQEPVFYEDVTLTATATAGATVKWYDGDVEAEGLTYVVTSASDASKTVTAKAFLNGCESAEVSKKVTFDAEDCTPDESKDIQITFTHPADIKKNGQWWGMGKMYNSSGTELKNMGCSTSGSTTFTLTNVVSSSISVYFEACYDWGYNGDNTKKATTINDKITLNRGKKYSITITNGDINATATATETGSITQDRPIQAPAVKMVSAEYDEVNDKIVAKGAVYKTGCGETFWGFQYSTDRQTWGTADVDFIHPSGNSLSVPGEFEYSFAIPKAGGGDIYYIRAYALNNYN
jgi:hypothetical protein